VKCLSSETLIGYGSVGSDHMQCKLPIVWR
jgi:hypothetical protein